MADETSVAEPEVGLETANPVVTETPQSEQSPAEPQTTSIPPKVEGDVNAPQAPEQPRPEYDGLFRRERKRLQRLEAELAELRREREASKVQDAPKYEPVDPSIMFQDPKKYHEALKAELRAEYQAEFRRVIEEREQRSQMEAKERKGLEALEKLFPKTSPDSEETLEERVNKDPQRAEMIKEFLDRPAVKAMAEADPDEAVAYAIEKLGLNKVKTNPLVLKKGAMGGVGTGNPSGGTKRAVSEEDLMSEKKKLDAQLAVNPNLRFDDNFKKRKAEVLEALTRLVAKK